MPPPTTLDTLSSCRFTPCAADRAERRRVDDVVATMDSFPAPSPPGVLVVDHDVVVRTAVAAYLRECGYVVAEAANGAEARTLLQSNAPIDVLFTVIELSDEHDGFALATWARQRKPELKVILASGVSRASEQATALCEHGPLLSKPYDHVSLERHIRRLLAKSPSDRR